MKYEVGFRIYEFMSTNTNGLVKAKKADELALSLDAVAEELKNSWLTTGNFARTIAYGLAMGKMHDALSDKVMQSLVKLKNCKLGFRTDEQNGNVYPIDVVRSCIIDAVTLGLQCVGNQFNIVGGNMYVTKEGFTYLLRELVRAGQLSGMKFVYHPAEISESSTQGTRRDGSVYQKIEREGRIKVDLSWCWMGQPAHEELEFCVRVNAGMSQDAIIGKAERKAKAWLYNYLTDQAISDGDSTEGAAVVSGEVVEVSAGPAAAVDAPVFLTAADAGSVALPGLVGTSVSAPAELRRDEEVPCSEMDEIPGLEMGGDEMPVFGQLIGE